MLPASATPKLVYVSDAAPGIRRLRRGQGFAYVRPDGTRLSDRRDAAELARIRSLAIPPAYTQVWICTLADGHVQATGRDARGRKQYRYHAAWRIARDDDKFEGLAEFGAALPRLRRRVASDLAAPVGERPRRNVVLAAVVRLLDTTLLRVGNDEYARSNGSYGLTTLRNRHVSVDGGTLHLKFRGKSGVLHERDVRDPRVARIVRRCQALPGQELFQYADEDGALHTVGSADVNAFLREITGTAYTAKSFRTWHASVHALDLLLQLGDAQGRTRAQINAVLAQVAARLGNTVAVCRKSYVYPRLLACAVEGNLRTADTAAVPVRGLTQEERRLLVFLQAR